MTFEVSEKIKSDLAEYLDKLKQEAYESMEAKLEKYLAELKKEAYLSMRRMQRIRLTRSKYYDAQCKNLMQSYLKIQLRGTSVNNLCKIYKKKVING